MKLLEDTESDVHDVSITNVHNHYHSDLDLTMVVQWDVLFPELVIWLKISVSQEGLLTSRLQWVM